MENVALGVQKL